MKLSEHLLNLFFPPKCPFCRKVLDSAEICAACYKGLPRTRGTPPVSGGVRCAAPLWYREEVRDAVIYFKFHGASDAAEPLGELVAECAAETFSGEFDVVTWVPVSKKRRRKRRYDQSELLARSACRRWDTQPVRLLEKTVDNPPQSGLRDLAARRANVLGVYEAVNEARIRGARVLLVDDIYTTGATMAECARVLREAGAADVMGVALARTPALKA